MSAVKLTDLLSCRDMSGLQMPSNTRHKICSFAAVFVLSTKKVQHKGMNDNTVDGRNPANRLIC